MKMSFDSCHVINVNKSNSHHVAHFFCCHFGIECSPIRPPICQQQIFFRFFPHFNHLFFGQFFWNRMRWTIWVWIEAFRLCTITYELNEFKRRKRETDSKNFLNDSHWNLNVIAFYFPKWYPLSILANWKVKFIKNKIIHPIQIQTQTQTDIHQT